MAEIFALTQALGLNIDPSEWPIPQWEKRLRRRLAWAVYVQDRWLSLNFGRSSHIQMEDWDVEPLNQEDFDSADAPGGATGCEHFLHLPDPYYSYRIETTMLTLHQLSQGYPKSLEIA
ncbi:hypothetical protein SLS56_004677 [Neofusicoccum ribis]|uniref:Xylanolytic transcriptional activator regulatory domain-containing protein n=1 Tax=Neofusicoccum ribis TaxID=45134 RepID=A0ABR3SWQ2_9PEZI